MKENVKKQLICSEMIGMLIQDMEINHAGKIKVDFHILDSYLHIIQLLLQIKVDFENFCFL